MADKRIPVIVDCDPGHDDAIAIMLLLSRPEFDVKGMVTVSGNQILEKTTLNARKVLAFLGREDVPVVMGSPKPILQECHPAKAHGKSGMDGPTLPNPTVPPLDMNAIEFYRKTIMESDTPVVLVPVGPLTNIAVLFHCHPEVKEKIACINLMGGGFYYTPGEYANVTPMAEFNIWHDAYAAQMVFDAGVPINMFGLDVTHKGGADDSDIDRFRTEGGKVGAFVAELLDFYSISYRSKGLAVTPIHDACPVAYMINPDLFTGEMHHVQVDLVGDNTFGGTIADWRPMWARRKRPFEVEEKKYVQVMTGVDRRGVLDLILQAAKSYE